MGAAPTRCTAPREEGGAPLCRQLVAVACLALLAVASASADSDADALIKFGLLGVWAVDCTEPPSNSSPQVRFAIVNGMATRTVLAGGLSQTMRMRNLRITAPDRLSYFLEGPTAEASHTMMVARVGEDIRSQEAVRFDGTAVIRDGRYVASGAPSPLYRRCSDRI